jgi:shikimate kinase
MTISLVGYRGTGKSTAGRILADRLGWPFVDTDEQIVTRCGISIAEIFSQQGEQVFRDLESQVVADLSDGVSRIVALGGGAVLREPNRQHMRRWGPVVWFRCRPDTIARRLRSDPTTALQRPSLTALGTEDEIQHVLAERLPLYSAISTHHVDTDQLSVEEIVEWILQNVLRRSAWSGEAPG